MMMMTSNSSSVHRLYVNNRVIFNSQETCRSSHSKAETYAGHIVAVHWSVTLNIYQMEQTD